MTTHLSPPVSHFNKEDQASYIAFEQKVNAHLADLQYNQELIIRAPTVAQAADVLLANVLCCANNQEPPAVPTGVHVKNFTLEALFGNRLHIDVGPSVGDGPLRSMWAQVIKMITSSDDSSLHISGDLYTPVLYDYPLSPQDIAHFKSLGFVIGLSLLHRLTFLPISPYLVLLMIHGFDAATDLSFIHKMSPNIMTRLDTWPPPNVTSLKPGADPAAMIMEHIPTTSLSLLRSRLEGSHCKAFIGLTTKQLISSFLFGTPHHQDVEAHPIITAMKDGFEKAFPADLDQFFPTLTNTLLILNHICARRIITHPEQVISKIRISNMADTNEASDPTNLIMFQLDFLKSVTRYLRGRGPPIGEGAEIEEGIKMLDAAYRSRRLMKAITGSEYLGDPIDQELNIHFVSEFLEDWKMAELCVRHSTRLHIQY
ncbi:hypothetical protein DXG01_003964 [Tephrocybe rancida]|nr:hypothetical protein DXG01_003964 [Tephrocybe rancida]